MFKHCPVYGGMADRKKVYCKGSVYLMMAAINRNM
jgi:hypothetical protein